MIEDLMGELRTMAEDHDDELCQEALGYIEKLEKERDYFQQQYVRKCEHEFEVRKRIEQLKTTLLEIAELNWEETKNVAASFAKKKALAALGGKKDGN
jgi:phage shock protein A